MPSSSPRSNPETTAAKPPRKNFFRHYFARRSSHGENPQTKGETDDAVGDTPSTSEKKRSSKNRVRQFEAYASLFRSTPTTTTTTTTTNATSEARHNDNDNYGEQQRQDLSSPHLSPCNNARFRKAHPNDPSACACLACANPDLHGRLARLRVAGAWVMGFMVAWKVAPWTIRFSCFLVCPFAATVANLVLEELTCRGYRRRDLALKIGSALVLSLTVLRPLILSVAVRSLGLLLSPTDRVLSGLRTPPWLVAGAVGGLCLFPLWILLLNAEGGATALVGSSVAAALAVGHAGLSARAALASALLSTCLGLAAAEKIKVLVLRVRGEKWVFQRARSTWYPLERKFVAAAFFPRCMRLSSRDNLFPHKLPAHHNQFFHGAGGPGEGSSATGKAGNGSRPPWESDPSLIAVRRRALLTEYEPRRDPKR